jgi:hypothetical protein
MMILNQFCPTRVAVDDARAAVAAGISAVGVIAPGHTREKDTPFLSEAGAKIILSPGMAELEVLCGPVEANGVNGDASPSKRQKTKK